MLGAEPEGGPRDVDINGSLRRYFWVLLAGVVVIVALGLLVLALSGVIVPVSIAFVPIALAAFDTGREQTRIADGAISFSVWTTLAAMLTLVTLALYAFVMAGAVVSQGGSLIGLVAMAGRLAVPIVILLLLTFLTIRVALWLGVRSRG